jgi:hypothetical protein
MDEMVKRLRKRATQISAQDFSTHDFSKLELRAIKDNHDFQDMKRKEVSRLKGKQLAIARKEILLYAKNELDSAQSVLGNSKGQFFAYTKSTEDLPKHKEIRDVLRSIDGEAVTKRNGKSVGKRIAAVEDALTTPRGLDYLHALSSSPTFIIADDALERLRTEYTIKNNPKLYESYQYSQYWYQQVRSLLAHYNSESIGILMLNEMTDPVSIEDHADAFPPLTSRDKETLDRKILEEQRARDKEDRDED